MDKKYFNKKQIKALSQYEEVLRSAYFGNYKSKGTTILQNESVADIYEEATGIQLKRNWSCATCNLQVWHQVGELYFLSKQLHENQ